MNRVDAGMVTTSNELAGYRIVRNYGIVRGIVVRSRSIIGNLGAALQTIVQAPRSQLLHMNTPDSAACSWVGLVLDHWQAMCKSGVTSHAI